jgi:hypothetical protein
MKSKDRIREEEEYGVYEGEDTEKRDNLKEEGEY